MDNMSEAEKDFFRETWARYLGYANEVGESFRFLVPVKFVRASYAIAFAYVLGDTVDKSWKIYQVGCGPKKVLLEAGDVLIWQTLASVIIPGIFINRICAHWHRYLRCKYKTISNNRINTLTMVAGLAAIPFIVHPIDSSVTFLMDHTYRKMDN